MLQPRIVGFVSFILPSSRTHSVTFARAIAMKIALRQQADFERGWKGQQAVRSSSFYNIDRNALTLRRIGRMEATPTYHIS